MHVTLDMLSMVRQTAVNLHKLDLGQRLQPERSVCSLVELLDDVSVLAEDMPKREGVRAVFSVAGEVHERDLVVTDRSWLFLILVNFLSNAFKNMRDGGVSVSISLVPADDMTPDTPHSYIRLQVADNGAGVPLELHPHLFTPYRQASKWRYGLGLGLYHVHELASALGGKVGHEPNVPSGAIFWAAVPLVPATHVPAPKPAPRQVGEVHIDVDTLRPQAPPPSSETAAAAASGAAGVNQPARLPSAADVAQPFAALRLLHVDDDPFIRRLTGELLQTLGVGSCELASDGEEGLKLLMSGNSYSLALVDLQMPMMDGFECVRRLREWEAETHFPRTRVCAVTANAEQEGCTDECLTAGFDEVLAKPATMAQLRELLLKAAEKEEAEGGGRETVAWRGRPSVCLSGEALEQEQRE